MSQGTARSLETLLTNQDFLVLNPHLQLCCYKRRPVFSKQWPNQTVIEEFRRLTANPQMMQCMLRTKNCQSFGDIQKAL